MSIRIIVSALLLASCASRIDTARLLKEAEETRTTLMRSESEVYGNFFQLRIFHQDLMQVTMKPEEKPYPTLDSLFHIMKNEGDAAIVQRLLYDSTYKQVKTLAEGNPRIKRNASNVPLLDTLQAQEKNLPLIQSNHSMQYFQYRKAYDKVVELHGVKRLSSAEYASLLTGHVEMWMDSLEEIGRMIAKEKVDLKKKFPEQKGPAFFAAYQPASELEAIMKKFESQLTQLQNSQSRFEEGNREDFIYYGPNVRPRLEVQATQDMLGSLALMMQEARDKEREYWGD